jgi:hypothetical protein
MHLMEDFARRNATRWRRVAAGALSVLLVPSFAAPQGQQVIEVLADRDSRFKIAGQKEAVITVHAGEMVTLRIKAIKARDRNRDGSVHGFSLLRAKDRKPVPGWDLLLKPGVQEFTLTVPAEPGDYEVVCSVICSDDHEAMRMRFVVLP